MCINTQNHPTVEPFMFISIFPNSARLHMKQWKHGCRPRLTQIEYLYNTYFFVVLIIIMLLQTPYAKYM